MRLVADSDSEGDSDTMGLLLGTAGSSDASAGSHFDGSRSDCASSVVSSPSTSPRKAYRTETHEHPLVAIRSAAAYPIDELMRLQASLLRGRLKLPFHLQRRQSTTSRHVMSLRSTCGAPDCSVISDGKRRTLTGQAFAPTPEGAFVQRIDHNASGDLVFSSRTTLVDVFMADDILAQLRREAPPANECNRPERCAPPAISMHFRALPQRWTVDAAAFGNCSASVDLLVAHRVATRAPFVCVYDLETCSEFHPTPVASISLAPIAAPGAARAAGDGGSEKPCHTNDMYSLTDRSGCVCALSSGIVAAVDNRSGRVACSFSQLGSRPRRVLGAAAGMGGGAVPPYGADWSAATSVAMVTSSLLAVGSSRGHVRLFDLRKPVQPLEELQSNGAALLSPVAPISQLLSLHEGALIACSIDAVFAIDARRWRVVAAHPRRQFNATQASLPVYDDALASDSFPGRSSRLGLVEDPHGVRRLLVAPTHAGFDVLSVGRGAQGAIHQGKQRGGDFCWASSASSTGQVPEEKPPAAAHNDDGGDADGDEHGLSLSCTSRWIDKSCGSFPRQRYSTAACALSNSALALCGHSDGSIDLLSLL